MSKPVPTARNKMMDYLSRREHTELELRQKLSRNFAEEEIEQAITYGKEKNWIPATAEDQQEMAGEVAQQLHRRKKGGAYINAFMQERGLPEIQMDAEQELAKALQLIENKYSIPPDLSPEEREREREKLEAKMGRFLQARGYDEEIVRKAIETCKQQDKK